MEKFESPHSNTSRTFSLDWQSGMYAELSAMPVPCPRVIPPKGSSSHKGEWLRVWILSYSTLQVAMVCLEARHHARTTRLLGKLNMASNNNCWLLLLLQKSRRKCCVRGPRTYKKTIQIHTRAKAFLSPGQNIARSLKVCNAIHTLILQCVCCSVSSSTTIGTNNRKMCRDFLSRLAHP